MSRIVIRNASILTLDDKDTFLYPATLVIQDDRIVDMFEGEKDTASDTPTTIIDGTDKLVMPGLIDLHFHTSVAKGYNDTLPLWEYLDTVWYPSIRSLTPSTALTAALHSYTTALKSGTTTVNDMYRFLPSLAAAARQTGIRAVLANDVALPAHALDSLATNVAAFHALDESASSPPGRIRVRLGLEWLPLADEPLLAAVAAAQRDLHVGLHIHLCESASEVADAAARFGGRTPVQVFRDAGLLGPRTVAAHCVHLSDADVRILAQTGTHVSFNPGSNAKLANGVARVDALVAAGVNVGLGVDAAECHNSTDMFESMKLGSYVRRAASRDAAVGAAREMLRFATENGARALGLDAGVLEVGRKADVILVDLRRDLMFTPLLREKGKRREMLESHLVFGCNGTAVDTVIVDGRIVVEGRKVLGVDEEQLRRDMDALFEDLVGEMEKQRFDREKAAPQ
ncbi:cytosine deaminase [Diplodia corticola]|uniref:Cytosine deaminase n=1 Tax=Diplodia corticola TaxID=236234 RepID=A0A1J9QR53_9PEZI|nr:cytosine deaminase [Diplodia corticola]OJD31422.1 cytosine deaminase [Diplodia corticola]